MMMLNAAIAHIGLGKVNYGNMFASDAIWLISGLLHYVIAHDWSLSYATLILVSQLYPLKRIKLPPLAAWWKLRHATFGGSTLFTALLGTNIGAFEPICTPLRWNIGHVLDHALWPAPAPPPVAASLTSNHQLHPAQLDREVTF